MKVNQEKEANMTMSSYNEIINYFKLIIPKIALHQNTFLD